MTKKMMYAFRGLPDFARIISEAGGGAVWVEANSHWTVLLVPEETDHIMRERIRARSHHTVGRWVRMVTVVTGDRPGYQLTAESVEQADAVRLPAGWSAVSLFDATRQDAHALWAWIRDAGRIPRVHVETFE